MPRVDGEYQVPHPDVIPDTTIESVVHNGIVHDLVFDANFPRPVTAGGTSAVSAAAARTNLQIEVREAAVTNYDDHVFEAGSFYSAAAATGAPAGGACTGLCTRNATTGDLFLQVTDQTSGVVYTKRRTGGVWSVWAAITTGLATIDYVNSVVSNTSLQALAHNGLQINGSMEVNQEGVTTSTHNTYFCDGWKLLKSGTMVIGGQQAVTPFFSAFTSFIQITVGTAQTSLSAGDFAGFQQAVEGYRVARLNWGTENAQSLTIGFWSRHVRSGVYTGTVRNSANDRSYAFTYTQAAADTPQYNTVTIPGDTAGTWLKTNGVGLYLAFSNGCGTTLTAPSASTWVAGNYLAAPGQVNGVAATSDVFRITGVVLLPETQALTAARSSLLMRPFDQELALCQRYFQKSYGYSIAPGTASLDAFGDTVAGIAVTTDKAVIPVSFMTRMRTTPIVSLYSHAGTLAKWSTLVGFTDTATTTARAVNDTGFGYVESTGLTVGAGYTGFYVADARL